MVPYDAILICMYNIYQLYNLINMYINDNEINYYKCSTLGTSLIVCVNWT